MTDFEKSIFADKPIWSEKEIIDLLRAGDYHRAMYWLLMLPTARGLPIITSELMGDLMCLHAEIIRLYRVEDRYKKLLKETQEFRKQKKIDRKSKKG